MEAQPETMVVGVGGIVFLLAVVAMFVLWLWSLIHCIMNKRMSDNNRIIGVVLIVVLGLIGSLVYLFLPRERALAGRRH